MYAHNSSTGNMLGHLWSKHRIDKDHLKETTTDRLIIKAMHIINKWRQEKIAQLLVEFIIKDCQPLHILHNQAFHQLLNYMEMRFHIPYIENEFDTLVTSEQLQQLLQTSQGRFKDHWLIELPVTTEELCDLVKAANPRIKNLKFLNNETIKTTMINRMQIFCDERNNHLPSVGPDKLSSLPTYEPTTNNDLIAALYNSEEPDDKILNKSKVDHYLCKPVEKRSCNPLA
ncbi:6154_t:CDS:2 [Cetraspora pellucida]|uniref:6154_t:CDS:1 n=1 Tax=Cetraspora pellucida TaxID=1433469 RepID=A0ACA9L2J2_9GLOM|nr:6154_t:CDS:2 [Cetraspora pellucida]